MGETALYICDIDQNDLASGVTKKILGQTKSFKKKGYTFSILNISKFRKASTLFNKITSRLPLFSSHYLWKDIIIKENYDLIYIRKPFMDINFMHFLQNLRQRHSEAIFVLEIPTYPYSRETRRIVDYPYLLKDFFWTHRLKQYIDLIVIYSDNYKELYDIPCVSIDNGIDMDTIRLKKASNNKKLINLIAVANINFWHGYDRVIRGMNNYHSYDKEDVHFYIVGDGPEKEKLIGLTKKFGLANKVHFCGSLSGATLDEVFDISDIAVGSLGIFRKGLKYASPIKETEYCARGIPFITTENQVYKDCKFVHFVSNDNSAISISDLVDWYNSNISNIPNFTIRQFASDKLSWDYQVTKILSNKKFGL